MNIEEQRLPFPRSHGSRLPHWRICRASLVSAGFLALACVAPAVPWQPAGGVLLTPWAKEVTPERALPEYPRPQMVRPHWVNLNGLWDYTLREQPPTAKNQDSSSQSAGGKPSVIPSAWTGQLLVPFPIESALSGVGRQFEPGQQLVYHRTFTRPELAKGHRLLLHFGAVDWQAVVYVNGRRVGEHHGGYDPFSLDITGALTAGSGQELMVEVVDPSDKGFQPAGKQSLTPPNKCYYTPVSGIWQTVWLETVPAAHITRVLAEASPSLDGFVVRVDAEGGGAGQKVTVQLRDGETVVNQATGVCGEPLRLAVSKPRVWSPETPHLYDLEVSLAGGDQVRSYCALRRIEILPDELGRKKLALNGKIQFQFGPLDQGYWPDGLYTAPTDEALRFDIEAMKRMGFNAVRKHIKVEPARWYYWCDKLGLMVWQDIPSARGLSGDDGRENFDREARAMIESLRPFPSIVMWVLFNEGWGQSGYGLAQSRQLADWLRSFDATRLVNAASGWTDVSGDHLNDLHVYPSPAMPPYDGARAAVVGEFGGLIAAVKDHLWRLNKGGRPPEDNNDLRNRYQQLLPSLRLCQGQGLAAAIYTQLTDVEGELNGYLTYDRTVQKMGADWLLSLHREFFTPAPAIATLAGGAVPWAFTTNAPGNNWQEPGFDDALWEHARGPFGANYRGAKTTTPWTAPAIRLRQTFRLSEPAEQFYLFAREMRGAVLRVSINGTPVPVDACVPATGWLVPLKDRQVLQTETNVLTVEATRRDGGGQASFDVRLLAEKLAH